MIIFEDKNIHQNSLYPDTDWTGKAKWIIPDDNTELCTKVFEYCPYFDVVEDEDGSVTDIIPTEKPVDLYKSTKIAELSKNCNDIIINGIDYNGLHYSLTINDQMNMEVLKSNITATTTGIPYHADGEVCRIYSLEEFMRLYQMAAQHKMYHTTYFNQLKDMVNKMSISSEIESCYYGMPLDEEHQKAMVQILNI